MTFTKNSQPGTPNLIFMAIVGAIVVGLLLAGLGAPRTTTAGRDAPPSPADNPAPPAAPVKLIFIHHSTGQNWLDDEQGRLGLTLRDNNYFVSDTNYGWGPDGIGDTTDIGHWWNWFAGPNRDTYTAALFAESGQHSSYSRLATDPGGENEIVMFKSCFPNSHLGGNPDDPPTTGDNPLRGQDAWSEYMTVGNAKGIYNDILAYFATRQDKLFMVITAPPLVANATDARHAANARAFNDWLVNDWLDGYPYHNVAVFDFYDVLTSNGGNRNTNDLGRETGNHHRWWNSAIQHIHTVDNDFAAYGSDDWDSHPTAAGGQKASAEFVDLLNSFYYHWRESGGRSTPTATLTSLPSATVTLMPTSTSTPMALPSMDPTFGHWFYLPLVMKGWHAPAPTSTPTPTTSPPGGRIQPSDLSYLGAFRLPADPDGMGWEWANWSSALTFYPQGDPTGPDDGFPGSLFGTGHDWHQYVSEVSIPVPVVSAAKNVADLHTATTLQPFADIRGGLVGDMEMPRVGLAYLPAQGKRSCGNAAPQRMKKESAFICVYLRPIFQGSQTTGKLYFAWQDHAPGQPEDTGPSHGWAELTLAHPQSQGLWRVGGQSKYVTGDYLFDIPQAWADAHTSGRSLGTGRFRDGGQAAEGPSLFAIAPWAAGNPPAAGTTLPATTLLLYEDVTKDNPHALLNYHHSDEWTGGAWLTAGNKAAVIFVGTKGTGECWYGCADGTNAPPWPEDCDRGWWSTGFQAQILFYDPADLAAVAAGTMPSWQPQPYATMNIDPVLYHITSSQQKYHVAAAAFDRSHGLLYVLEPLADDDRPLVHVWKVQ